MRSGALPRFWQDGRRQHQSQCDREHDRHPNDPTDLGDMWIWRAIAVPSRLRVVSHLGHERREDEATAISAKFKAKTDGYAPCFTSDQLPAYGAALTANYSTPEPPPLKRGPGVPGKRLSNPLSADHKP